MGGNGHNDLRMLPFYGFAGDWTGRAMTVRRNDLKKFASMALEMSSISANVAGNSWSNKTRLKPRVSGTACDILTNHRDSRSETGLSDM